MNRSGRKTGARAELRVRARGRAVVSGRQVAAGRSLNHNDRMKYLSTRTGLILWLMVLAGACGSPDTPAVPSGQSPRAASAAAPGEGKAPGPGSATRLAIEPEASEVGFLLSTTWHNVEGHTKAVTGAIVSESGDIFADGLVTVEIEAAKLETGNRSRDRTMRDDCLETAKNPKITFVSTGPPAIGSSTKDPGGGYREVALTVPGDLTIHGVKRSVRLPVTLRRDGAGWTVSGKLPVKLSEYSIPDPSIVFNKVKDDVTVTLAVRVN